MLRIGIRREDKSPWEARVPIIPAHVAVLRAAHGLRFTVQPCEQRVFAEEEYAEAGAELSEDLGDCGIIIGVKEIPEHIFERDKTYLFFSHTIKGQPYNMSMLRRMMELRCQLIDYELVVDDEGRRLVFFGYHAGLAGMIDTLWSLGQRLGLEGHDTPLADLQPAHEYESLKAVEEHLAEVATRITQTDALAGLGPVVCGFAGYGQVARGARHIYRIFAPTEIAPHELATLDGRAGDGQFFEVVFKEGHLVRPVDPAATFELQDYYDHPEKYAGDFEQFLPHLTVLVNCIFWTPRYPRLVTIPSLERLYAAHPTPRLKVIGDISCDPSGSIEVTVKPTDPGNPVYVYDVDRGVAVDGFAGRGPVVMAVEILPAELPRESSEAFSEALVDLLPGLAKSDPSGGFGSWALPAPLKGAVILHHGKLTEKYACMKRYLEEADRK